MKKILSLIVAILFIAFSYTYANDKNSKNLINEISNQSININSFISAPKLLKPEKDSRFGIDSEPVKFLWSYVYLANKYYIEFDLSDSFENPVGGLFVDSNMLDLSELITQEQWAPINLTIYWRVYAIDRFGDWSEPSEIFWFHKTTIEPPTLQEPIDGAILPPDSRFVTMQWLTVPNAKYYEIQFLGDDKGKNIYGSFYWDYSRYDSWNNIDQSLFLYSYFTVYWRVSAIDEMNRKGPWSEIWQFTKLGFRRFLAYGDSITGGYGSSSFDDGFGGYPPILLEMLKNMDNNVTVISDWFSGGKAEHGAWYAEDIFLEHLPSVVIINFGIVDIVDPGNCSEPFNCKTIENLDSIAQTALSLNITPILTTLIPLNPEGERAFLQPKVIELNEKIRELAQENNYELVDLEQIFYEEGGDNLSELYFDWVHPNDEGYRIIAEAIYTLIRDHWGQW